MSGTSYRDAGVDLEQYQKTMQKLPEFLQRTHRPGVMALPGGFAGLFRLFDGRRFEDPVLVSGTDGVGTKIKVATHLQKFDTIGVDLVAMCVNDCLCLGAEPLFFLDYIAMDRDRSELTAALVSGVSDACVEAGMALLGGETAIMPDVYPDGEFDMAGFCVGVVERTELIDGTQAIKPGDVIIGADSDGFHSNGYSLVRKVVFEKAGLDVNTQVDSLGETVGSCLLRPTRIYARQLRALMDANLSKRVHGIAHITGGGLPENVERILPKNCHAHIDTSSWQPAAQFGWLQELGSIADDEMYRVFNMGIGMTFVVAADAADTVLTCLRGTEVEARVIGTIQPGTPGVTLT